MTNQKKKPVVVGVIYPEVRTFFRAYLDSISKQTISDFDLVLFNDGFKDPQCFLRGLPINSVVLEKSKEMRPSENRYALIRAVLGKGYTHVIFSDCDDYYPPNRVEMCLELLDSTDIVVNDLDIVSENRSSEIKGYLSKRYSEREKISLASILDCNSMGFTNTGARAESLARTLPFIDQHTDILAFDWFFWTHVLSNGFKAEFTASTSSKYRIYKNNIAGLPQLIDIDNVKKSISVKAMHYKELAKRYPLFESRYVKAIRLESMLTDEARLIEYVSALESIQLTNPLWWEHIVDLEEM